jgi:N,N'-diacetylbacillosaminyl-diphospho-undecaprenol alpha-1,3-N-acetylgalactosaminyltransferase
MVGDRKLILFVGRKDKVKDIGTFFKAMREVINKKGKDNVNFYLVGDYARKDIPDDLREAVFSGVDRMESKDMPATYYVSYLLVSASLSESFGKVMVEANACGKPVVATDTTGAKEIIKDGYNGFLVPVGDAEQLTEKILYLLDYSDKAKEMGENGRKVVKEKFSDNLQIITDYWKQIVNK